MRERGGFTDRPLMFSGFGVSFSNYANYRSYRDGERQSRDQGWEGVSGFASGGEEEIDEGRTGGVR
jgi:hypothetical protein